MGGAPVHVANERLKGLTGVLYNLGTALFAAGVARAWTDSGLTPTSVGWLLIAVIIIFAASQLLSLLEAED